MSNWNYIFILALAGTTIMAASFTPVCRILALKWGFLDKPLAEAHKAHKKPIPVLGGLAMCLAWVLTFLLGLAAAFLLKPVLPDEITKYFTGLESVMPKLLTAVLGAIAMTVLGMTDDRRAMKAGKKFFLQFLIAAAVATQCHVSFLHMIPGMNWLFTTLWIMTVVNALNFFDNMDGLAGGTATIAAAFFLLIAAIRGQVFVALLSATTCGAALGFLFFNRPPASIFMGDGGSHFLGFSLALSGILTTFYQTGESLTTVPIIIPVLVLSLPLFDAVTVVLIRLHEHRPFYIGDNRHISHRFVNLGFTRPQAVAIIWLLALIQGTGAITLVWLPPVGAALVLLQAIAIFIVIAIIQLHVPEQHHDLRKS